LALKVQEDLPGLKEVKICRTSWKSASAWVAFAGRTFAGWRWRSTEWAF